MAQFLRNTKGIIKRELAGYFGSPVAYVIIIIFLLLCGFFTFYVSHFYEQDQADLQAFFQWHPWIFLFLVPAVAMRLWADERRAGTIELILTLPITTTEAIMGKFLAAWFFLGITFFLSFPLIITVIYLGDPDVGPLVCSYIGSYLMAGAYLSVGCMTSSLTRNQVISFILSVVICLFLVLAGWSPVTNILSGWAPSWLVDTVAGFSFIPHYITIQRGIIDLRDLLYFFSVMFFMLVVNAVVLQSRKAS